jgi:non-specific serine/threonine protein kinase
MTIDTAIAMTLGEGDGSPKPSSVAAAGPSSSLTDRECQIVALLAAGKSNADIGRTLVVSTRTAETHVRHIMDKLGLSSRAQIAAWAASGGMDSD